MNCSISPTQNTQNTTFTAGTIPGIAIIKASWGGKEATANAYVLKVDIVSIDATVPFSTKINYRAKPSGVIFDSALCTILGKDETKNNVSGDFYFTYNQKNLPIGTSVIRLKLTIAQTTFTVDCTAERSKKITDAQEMPVARIRIIVAGISTVFWIPIVHGIFEDYHKISYSVPIVTGSKTVWVGDSHVNIETQPAAGVPTEIGIWTEIHLYRDKDGEQLKQYMTTVTYPTIPEQGSNFRSMDSSNDVFFKPTNNRKGIGQIKTLNFKSDAGPVFPDKIINPSVDVNVE
jgi:hypothetical protein